MELNEEVVREYTIYDFLSRKKQFWKYCSNLTCSYHNKRGIYVFHRDRADDLFSDATLELLKNVFNGKSNYTFNNDHMLEAFVKLVIKRCYIKTFSDIHKSNQVNNRLTYYQDFTCDDDDSNTNDNSFWAHVVSNQHLFSEYKENIDIQSTLRVLNSEQKKIAYKAYLGYSQIEIAKQMKIGKSAISDKFKDIREKVSKTELCQN